ncbi:Ribosomal-protein-serine acetyltransferase [Corynebacterium glaucum]|nr:Ribosomal-protein-serine acetyltransferase [Corynebacterium glaucum]
MPASSVTAEFSWPIPCLPLRDGELELVPWGEVASISNVREDLVESCNDPRMVRWTQVPHPYTEAHAAAFLEMPANELRWALVVDERYCGNVALRLVSEQHRAAEFGYNAAQWMRGRGMMTRAVHLVTEHAFAHSFHRLVIRANVDNAASRHVAEACGYTLEGVLRGAELLHGEFVDLAQYARLTAD